MADGVDSRDRFLAEIAAFGEADGTGIAGDFLWQVFRRDVDAEQGHAGFEPCRVEGWMAAANRAGLLESLADRFHV